MKLLPKNIRITQSKSQIKSIDTQIRITAYNKTIFLQLHAMDKTL